jgi:hypothetical protein
MKPSEVIPWWTNDQADNRTKVTGILTIVFSLRQSADPRQFSATFVEFSERI